MDNGIAGPAEVLSDIYFLEVISTDEEFMRARQQAGGGGGQGGRQQRSSALVETQKQIIAATWKLLKKKSRMSSGTFDEDVTVVAESQTLAMQRAQMSLRRLAERFSFSDESYDNAVLNLKEAVDHMHEAAEKLHSQDLQDALGPEQQALRSILKAEADGRRTQVQMARNPSGGGGGGGQQREREDLRELFEMEMGKLENRYEMPQQGGGGGGDQEDGEEDDTLARLRELSQRQERLNRAQQDLARRKEQITEEQMKRRLEELRREQEELGRQAESMSQQMSRLARQNPGQGQSGQQRQMEQAADQMREAAQSLLRRDPDMAAAKSRKALENLRNQEKEMSSQQSASLANLVDDLNRRAQELRSNERQVQRNLENIREERDRGTPYALVRDSEDMRRLQETKEQMKQDLAEMEEMLRTVGARGRRDRPELADRAIDALRSLGAERLEGRIDESQQVLQQGWLNLAMEMEKRIQQSVDRVGRRLQELDQNSPRTEEEQLDQASTNVRNLRRELEDLQQQVASMRREAQQQQANARQQSGQQSGQQPGQSQQQAQQPGGGGNRDGDINRLREGLQRSRRYARGLVQPWARGERWSSDARSIHRDLTQAEIEDFLNQPDLFSHIG